MTIRGSSPRVRGTPFSPSRPINYVRFIPARAGNTSAVLLASPGNTVHPRACGEHPDSTCGCCARTGSSPRVRGTLRVGTTLNVSGRFIPARAGNTMSRVTSSSPLAVHPRACGEHPDQEIDDDIHDGSSPRVRGTRFRGGPGCCRAAVHPRACGEHKSASALYFRKYGSSPRVRGTQLGADHKERVLRFIPARAGNTADEAIRCEFVAVHPRACGEHNKSCRGALGRIGSSPRVRGTHRRVLVGSTTQRFIPARAGNTVEPLLTYANQTVHPRACGEHLRGRGRSGGLNGSSPRVRGTLRLTVWRS